MKDYIVDPPAIVKPAERDEKWDLHVKAAIGFGRRAGKSLSLAGAELLKAKMGCPPGLWLKTLARHGVKPRTAQLWIESFRRFSECATIAHLNALADEVGRMAQGEDGEIPNRETGDEPEDHPLLQIILCTDCRRKGPARDCKKCQAARLAFVGNGGKGRSKKHKGGNVRFDWKKLEPHLSHVYQIPERLAKAYPDAAKSKEHRETARLLTELADTIKRLRELIQGAA